jgi:hypothetical protein
VSHRKYLGLLTKNQSTRTRVIRLIKVKVKVKQSHYRPGQAYRSYNIWLRHMETKEIFVT